ncbi:PREDICTED: gelsolin-like [Cyprinodon variegatus]|uniref:gelsolin-like n=1 Tax=Cyprinodon variegatus TaxID=28743 RepID=UPI000742B57C|nr:PREDICTED: gelsolin-like [Cyprinodon variegatus]
MVSHKEFQNAGKEPGLQVWRIENMDLKPVPKALHGSFYTGDAYLLLFTTSAPSYCIHMWLGNECSQDEYGAAAIFATQLDDFLGGGPVQFREMQNNESTTFLGYFKSGIKYQKGGVASGFKHVVTNDMSVKRLLHVKGRRAIRATEVDLSWSSFNKGDCFIIDLGKDVYQWCGSECNRFERLKASQVAIDIRDNERNGRAKVHMVEEGSEPSEIIEALGPKSAIAPSTPDDDKVDTSNKRKGALYMISDASGSMKVSCVAQSSPFKQACPKANPSERKAAMSAGQQFIKDKGYSNKTQIQVLPAGAETILFKQFFSDWRDKDETTGPSKAYTIGRIAKVEQVPFDASSLHSNATMAAQHGMVDDGKGKVQIWRVEGGDRVPVDPSTNGHFYGGDCYLILYSYRKGSREQHIIYTWQGLKCTQDELAASAFLTVKLDDSMGGSPVQVRVTQGQEPPHLMSLFQGKPMIIHSGGTSRKGGQSQPGSTRLFHIRQSSSGATRAVEVEASASNLNTNDVFVLKSPKGLFVWRGVGASEEEMNAAKHVVGFLGGSPNNVSEGKEPVSLSFTSRHTAKDYVDSDPSGRKGLPITTIKQGAEPPTFTGWFQAWDAKMWDKDPLDRIRARF